MNSASSSALRTRRLAVAGIALANVIGGLAYPLQKEALQGLPPATVTFLRNAVAVAALLCLVRARRRPARPWPAADARRAVLLGTLAFALPMWLGIAGVERSSAANGSILILLEPVTIVALAWLVFRERIGALKLAGLVLGLLGALVVVFGEGASPGELLAGPHVLGNGLLLLHGILWGCYTPLAKPLTERHEALDLSLRTTAAGTLALALPALAEHARWSAGPALRAALLCTLVLGLFVSCASVVLWLWALRHIPATSVAGFVFLQPLCGVLAGCLFQGERLAPATLAGAALISLGVALDVLQTAARPATDG